MASFDILKGPHKPSKDEIFRQNVGPMHDTAMIRSIIGSTTIIQGYNEIGADQASTGNVLVSISIRVLWPHSTMLDTYHDEFNHSTKFKCGSYTKESNQLAYSICRLITGEKSRALKLWKPFLLEHVLFWDLNFEFTADELQRKIERIAIRLS